MTRVATALLLLLLTLSGCARTVSVPAPDASGSAVDVCERLVQDLPADLGGASRRDVTPATRLTAAWGDPPIVLRCGVPRPGALTPTSEVVEVNGVSWFPEPLSAGYRFTTTGRAAYVEVTVPDAYRPEVNPLAPLADPVRSRVPAA